MKKIVRQIAFLAILLLLICFMYRWATGNRYTAFVPIPKEIPEAQAIRVIVDQADRMENGKPERFDGYARIQLKPMRNGESSMRIVSEAGTPIAQRSFQVGPLMTVYDPSTGGFTGDSVVLLAFTAFCFAVAFLMLRWFLNVKWTDFYGYGTIYAAGFSIFALLVGALMAYVSFRHIVNPLEYPMLSAYKEISRASWGFMMVTAPIMLAFAAAMAVSNIALLRHERVRVQNLLGILAGVFLVIGLGVGWLLYRQNTPTINRGFEVLRCVYTTVFAYFECMLIGAIICGLKAARHRPDYDRDYIIILGCRFRKDGTLTPLLKGRVDAAVAFWRAQLEKTGKAAMLVPSGGQGDDEVMAEAEAMRRYLIQQKIPEENICMEDRSRNTYQNMAFSREIIGNSAKVAYATTNYHVFRSGVWASLAGLSAEGIGSTTRWWYWPNAFMRECLGLLKNRWKQELLGLMVLIVFYFALSAILI